MALGTLNLANVKTALLLLPVAMLGVFCGWKVARALPERFFFLIVQWVLFLVSCKLIYDGVTSLFVF